LLVPLLLAALPGHEDLALRILMTNGHQMPKHLSGRYQAMRQGVRSSRADGFLSPFLTKPECRT
jgi:hypothetical protein